MAKAVAATITAAQVLILPAVLLPDTIVSSIGLPRVIREERTNHRVVEEMGPAGIGP